MDTILKTEEKISFSISLTHARYIEICRVLSSVGFKVETSRTLVNRFDMIRKDILMQVILNISRTNKTCEIFLSKKTGYTFADAGLYRYADFEMRNNFYPFVKILLLWIKEEGKRYDEVLSIVRPLEKSQIMFYLFSERMAIMNKGKPNFKILENKVNMFVGQSVLYENNKIYLFEDEIFYEIFGCTKHEINEFRKFPSIENGQPLLLAMKTIREYVIINNKCVDPKSLKQSFDIHSPRIISNMLEAMGSDSVLKISLGIPNFSFNNFSIYRFCDLTEEEFAEEYNIEIINSDDLQPVKIRRYKFIIDEKNFKIERNEVPN